VKGEDSKKKGVEVGEKKGPEKKRKHTKEKESQKKGF